MSLRDRVVATIEEKLFNGRRFDLADDESFLEAGVIDSLGMMELVALIEQRFGIKVEDEELMPENLDSVAAICEYLTSKDVRA